MNKINAQIVLWGCYTLSTFSPPSVHLGYACDEAATYYPSRKSKIFTRGPRIYPTENTFGGGGPGIPRAPHAYVLTALRHRGRAFTVHAAESA